ncbi:disks large-associated protein 4 isoform X1 [Anguilla rostrata]|uniref:disks large-associated protein 4 isoform X1 n=2 Tax=Anguilla rostrata TaxID=7938 RepID=UPI0030CCBD84
MKRLGANRSRILSDSCDIMAGPQEPLYPLAPDPHTAYLLSPTMDHYGTLEFPPPSSPTSLPPECLMSLSAQLSNSATYPCMQYNSLDPGDPMALGAGGIGGGIQTGGAGHSVSMGMGAGLGQSGAGHMITSGSATISGGGKANRLPGNLLDQLERRVQGGGGGGGGGAGGGAGPGAGPRNGFSTLQFQRGRVAKQRSESPGRIRHLMHSVQKLFTKSQSLECSAKAANANGGAEGARGRRSKSKDRAKTEGAKRRPRSNMSGLWTSEDNLDNADPVPVIGGGGGGGNGVGMGMGIHRNPGTMMTLGRTVSDGQGPARYFPQGYNTISGHMLKASKISNELKCPPPCPALPAPRGEAGGGGAGGAGEAKLMKRGSWSTLTLTQARQVCQKGLATLDKSMLKSKSCHQDLAYHYLQVGGRVPLGDWNSTLGPSRGSSEIPCRRMRSGSYVKAMGDLEDSEDSEGSPKPSPKSAARRQSYQRATQHSLSEQLPPRNCLPSLSELSTNRSLDNLDGLDCMDGPAASPFQPWDDMDFSQGFGTLGRSSLAGQMQELSAYSESAYRRSGCGPAPMPVLPPLEPLDLPLATCFRSRSQSYVRAIQAGCSQDEDTASADSDTPPPTTTVRTYSSSTTSTCITTSKKAPPPVPPRTTSKPFISVTVQSSTESAQDTYLDGHDHKSEANSQSGHSNSSDSLTSTRAGGPAKAPPPAPPAPREPPPREPPPPNSPPGDPPQHEILKITTTCARADPLPKRKLSSIGIQVDCNQPAQKQDTPPLARFQSIGVQVEDGWQQSRSNSMASKQEADTDTQDLPAAKPSLKSVGTGSQAADSPPHRLQNNGEGRAPRPLTSRTSSASFSETLDPALDPSSLPPPDPWLESGNGSAPSGPAPPGASACRRDGHWFLKLLQAETARMEGWCQQMEQETKDNQLTEEVLGKIRSAVGSAQLLMSQKFQQFRGLCDQNLNLSANPRPTAQDLAGFWDLLQLSIEDISLKFDELYHLKSNDWQLADSPEKKEEKKQPPPVPKKPSKAKVAAGREKAGQPDPSTDKQRQEARKRLMAAKRAASVRQNSATESADSIEIYVPEAQTRL